MNYPLESTIHLQAAEEKQNGFGQYIVTNKTVTTMVEKKSSDTTVGNLYWQL